MSYTIETDTGTYSGDQLTHVTGHQGYWAGDTTETEK
jgi:hypothetical protein